MTWPDGWAWQLPIEIKTVDSLLSDFTVLISSLPDHVYENALNGGGDLRFYSGPDGTGRLAADVRTFDTVNRRCEIAIKVSSLSQFFTTPVYLRYGKAGESQPAITDTYGRHSAYDSSHKYVWPLNEAGNGTAGEYTNRKSPARHGQGGGGTTGMIPGQVAGLIHTAADFDGYNDHIKLPADSGSVGDFTLSTWVNVDAPNTNYASGVSRSYIIDFRGSVPDAAVNDSIAFHFDHVQATSTHELHGYVMYGGVPLAYTQHKCNAGNIVGSWHQYAFQRSGTTIKLFVDGVQQTATYVQNATTRTTAQPMTHGATLGTYPASVVGGAYWLNGKMSNTVLSAVARSGAWIKAEFDNLHSPAMFLTFGDPDGGVLPSRRHFLMGCPF